MLPNPSIDIPQELYELYHSQSVEMQGFIPIYVTWSTTGWIVHDAQRRMMSNSNEVRARAEASFKRKEEQARQGAKAWADYEAQRRATAEKTEQLRALRLAKEAAESAAAEK
jgi:hypothetical protein